MSVLLQISDTHFGTEEPQVAEALVALAAQQRPDVVVRSGDITQRARQAQFRAAIASNSPGLRSRDPIRPAGRVRVVTGPLECVIRSAKQPRKYPP